MRLWYFEMKKLLFPGLFLISAALCFPNGGADEDTAAAGKIDTAPDLTTIAEFNPDLNFAQVLSVEARLESAGSWYFAVTVRHKDEGWDHYADLWEVVDPETFLIYGQRVLAHPHDTEQPFLRSQRGIKIPAGVSVVLVRARCTGHGFKGKAVLVDLTVTKDADFSVVR
jgi:hypothetical protein